MFVLGRAYRQGQKLKSRMMSTGVRTNWIGHFVLQMIKNKDGLHVIECNPRIGGASTLAFAAGLNTPMWSIVEALGEDLSNYPFISNSSPIQLVRTPVDIILDFSF